MGEIKRGGCNSCCKIDPIQLALIATFITLIGDFIAFIAALIASQEQCKIMMMKKFSI